MIIFKRKEFGLVNTVGGLAKTGGTALKNSWNQNGGLFGDAGQKTLDYGKQVVGMIQDRRQQKMQQEAMKRQQEQMRKQMLHEQNQARKMQQAQFSAKTKIVTEGLKKTADALANSGLWKKISNSKVYKESRKASKDLIEVGKERGSAQKIADMLAMGSTMAAGEYLVDKVIQADLKKHGVKLDKPERKKNKLKTALGIGTATLGSTAAALALARKGKLNKETAKKVAGLAGRGFKSLFSIKDPKTGKINALSVLGPVTTLAFPLLTVANYLPQRQQLIDQAKKSSSIPSRTIEDVPQIKELPEAASVSAPLLSSSTSKKDNNEVIIGRGLPKSLTKNDITKGRKRRKKEKSSWEKTKDFISGNIDYDERKYSIVDKAKKIGKGIGKFFLFGYDKEGREKLSEQLAKQAEKSGSGVTKRLSKGVNPKNALLGTLVGLGLAHLAFKPFGYGDSIIRKPLRAIDKDAYLYQDSQGQFVD